MRARRAVVPGGDIDERRERVAPIPQQWTGASAAARHAGREVAPGIANDDERDSAGMRTAKRSSFDDFVDGANSAGGDNDKIAPPHSAASVCAVWRSARNSRRARR